MTLIPLHSAEARGREGRLHPQPKEGNAPTTVYLHRRELEQILSVYSRMVALGKWRDYGIHFGDKAATFAIFRRSSEQPMFRVVKEPALAKKQGMWRVSGQNGQILKRGHDLKQVLKVFDRLLMKSID